MSVSILDYKDKFKGRPAAVLGGGPSLPLDLQEVPPDAIMISVNQHALLFCDPQFIVYMDEPAQFAELDAALKTFPGLKVSPHSSSDIRIGDADWWDGGMSSSLATWFACWLGCGPVLLCGMDCYQGEKKYCYDRTGFYHPVFDEPLESHFRAWRPALTRCPNATYIKAVSGPLVEIFGRYE